MYIQGVHRCRRVRTFPLQHPADVVHSSLWAVEGGGGVGGVYTHTRTHAHILWHGAIKFDVRSCSIYIYIHVYMYICIYICILAYMCIHIFVYKNVDSGLACINR